MSIDEQSLSSSHRIMEWAEQVSANDETLTNDTDTTTHISSTDSKQTEKREARRKYMAEYRQRKRDRRETERITEEAARNVEEILRLNVEQAEDQTNNSDVDENLAANVNGDNNIVDEEEENDESKTIGIKRRRQRRWCFTIYPHKHAYGKFPMPSGGYIHPFAESRVRYLIYNTERCPKTGTLHLQGYLECMSPVDFLVVKRDILQSMTANIREAKGSAAQNREYCSKSRTQVPGTIPYEFGDIKDEEKPKVLDEIIVMSKTGAKLDEIVERYPKFCFMNLNKVEDWIDLMSEKNVKSCKKWCEIRWGDPGTGKSYGFQEEYGNINIYKKTAATGRFMSGYKGEAFILFEEFKPKDLGNLTGLTIQTILTLMDDDAMIADKKNSRRGIRLRHKAVGFTSNEDPRTWLVDYPQCIVDAFFSRICRIYHYYTGPVCRHNCGSNTIHIQSTDKRFDAKPKFPTVFHPALFVDNPEDHVEISELENDIFANELNTNFEAYNMLRDQRLNEIFIMNEENENSNYLDENWEEFIALGGTEESLRNDRDMVLAS